MNIREVAAGDWHCIWPIFQEIVQLGDTYGFDPDLTKDEAETIWLTTPRQTFVFEEDGKILGSYYIKTNMSGPGSHVSNCGYMVTEAARGKGLATKMCEHSQQIAVNLGYKAMQFNFVASSNEGAIYLWKKLGFEIVGRLPGAFNHPTFGFIDSFVMFKTLRVE